MLNLDWRIKAGAIALTVIFLVTHGSIWFATRQYYIKQQADAVSAAKLIGERAAKQIQSDADLAALNSAELHGQLTEREKEIAALRVKFLAERTARLARDVQATATSPAPPALVYQEPELRAELADCTKLGVLLDEALGTSKAETLSVRKEVGLYKGLDLQRQETIKQLTTQVTAEQRTKGFWRTGFWATAGSTAVLLILKR